MSDLFYPYITERVEQTQHTKQESFLHTPKRSWNEQKSLPNITTDFRTLLAKEIERRRNDI